MTPRWVEREDYSPIYTTLLFFLKNPNKVINVIKTLLCGQNRNERELFSGQNEQMAQVDWDSTIQLTGHRPVLL
jgi:hypothetical protein